MSRYLPEGLLVAVFDAFGTVVPDGVYLVKRGDSYSAYGSDGVTGGHFAGALPAFPASDAVVARFALQAYVDELRRLVADVLDQPWPARGAKTRVSVGDPVRIWFGDGSWGSAVVRLPEIHWTGPLSEPRQPRRTADINERRYAGTVSEEQRAEHAAREQENRRQSAAHKQAFSEARAAIAVRAPGQSSDQLRRIAHEEFTSRGLTMPTGMERFFADLYGLEHSEQPRLDAVGLLARAARDISRFVRHHPEADDVE